MVRMFKTHAVRISRELEGLWDFVRIDNGKRDPKTYTHRLPVPGCWENHPDFVVYRGKGAYRTSFDLARTTALRIEFKGVSHTAEVFLNGKRIGSHYNAYTPFAFVLPSVPAGTHELRVVADNSFGPHSTLHRPNDYYCYGGISRPVVIEEIASAYIEWVHFTPTRTGTVWTGHIEVRIVNTSQRVARLNVRSTIAGQSVDFGTVTIAAGGTRIVTKDVTFKAVRPWSHEDPFLYLFESVLIDKGSGMTIDDLIERVGFRTVTVKGSKLVVNGTPVFLKGFNRHEDHPHAGCALPFAAMVKDLDLIRDMNGNAVRTSHYPNDELFLDLCDESGIFVWEENHARGLSIDIMQNPLFMPQCEACNREMVTNHYNHPSIVMWAILNECASHTTSGRAMYKKQLTQIRKMDASRPCTFATCHHHKDKCLDLGDIVSLNSYARWYGDMETAQAYVKSKKWVDRSGGKGKPVIISEFGAAALYGFREPTHAKFTEERQADILEEALTYYSSRKEIAGLFIWQFCDVRITDDAGWPIRRPRAKNNKGIVDEYRRPKLAYDTVKKIYGAAVK